MIPDYTRRHGTWYCHDSMGDIVGIGKTKREAREHFNHQVNREMVGFDFAIAQIMHKMKKEES